MFEILYGKQSNFVNIFVLHTFPRKFKHSVINIVAPKIIIIVLGTMCRITLGGPLYDQQKRWSS